MSPVIPALFGTWRPAGRETRVGTLITDNYVSRKIIANLLDRRFQT